MSAEDLRKNIMNKTEFYKIYKLNIENFLWHAIINRKLWGSFNK